MENLKEIKKAINYLIDIEKQDFINRDELEDCLRESVNIDKIGNFLKLLEIKNFNIFKKELKILKKYL